MQSYSEIFIKRAFAYHQAMLRQPLARAQEFQNLCSFVELTRCTHVLDVPSGTGYLRPYLPGAVTLTELDFSMAFTELGLGTVQQATPDSFGGEAERFDHVLSLTGLHHLPDVPAFARECHRVLKSDGRLIIGEVREGSPVAAFLNEFVHAHNSMGHEGVFLNRGFAQTLEKCGFTEVQYTDRPYHWIFADEGSMASFCASLFGLDRATPETVLGGLRDYLGYARVNGQCRLRWELTFFTARKA